MMTLGSTPACDSRTTCASGLVGKISGGGATGVAGCAVVSGAVGSDGVWALEVCSEHTQHTPASANAANAGLKKKILEIKVFINGPFSSKSFIVSTALTVLTGKVFKWPGTLNYQRFKRPAGSNLKHLPHCNPLLQYLKRRLVPPPGIELGSTV
jgi:hypothetical protein